MAAAVISSKSDDNVPLGWVRLVGWKKNTRKKDNHLLASTNLITNLVYNNNNNNNNIMEKFSSWRDKGTGISPFMPQNYQHFKRIIPYYQ